MPVFQKNTPPFNDPNEVLYQRRCANFIYVVPPGLPELMNDISREVLRHHPEPRNLCGFIADYLECLMTVRENAKIASKFVESITESGCIISQLLDRAGITKEQAEKAARVIQRTYRRYQKLLKIDSMHSEPSEEELTEIMLRKLKIDRETAIKCAIVIQRAYRSYLKQSTVYSAYIDWRYATKRALSLYRSSKATHEEMHRAATLIKSAYKAYYTRRFVKNFLHKHKKDSKRIMKGEVVPETVEDTVTIEEDAFFEADPFDVIDEYEEEHESSGNEDMKTKEDMEQEDAKTTVDFEQEEKRNMAARIIQRSFRLYLEAKRRKSEEY